MPTTAPDLKKEFMKMPNVGPKFAEDLIDLGIRSVADLRDKEPVVLYRALCTKTGSRQDPCVLDTFMAVVDYSRTGQPRKWWDFTAMRKELYPDL